MSCQNCSRLERTILLQRAALEQWKAAYPHDTSPVPAAAPTDISGEMQCDDLASSWREKAVLCTTKGLRDERAKHRAIVYNECADELGRSTDHKTGKRRAARAATETPKC
jgi:hypothetical protein